MIPAFERAKTVYALDRAATVIGTVKHWAELSDVKKGSEERVGHDIRWTYIKSLIYIRINITVNK
jgi:hypothetical protein